MPVIFQIPDSMRAKIRKKQHDLVDALFEELESGDLKVKTEARKLLMALSVEKDKGRKGVVEFLLERARRGEFGEQARAFTAENETLFDEGAEEPEDILAGEPPAEGEDEDDPAPRFVQMQEAGASLPMPPALLGVPLADVPAPAPERDPLADDNPLPPEISQRKPKPSAKVDKDWLAGKTPAERQAQLDHLAAVAAEAGY